jgi:hypothetical protein
MPLVGQLVARNNEVSALPGMAIKIRLRPVRSRRNSDPAPRRNSGYGDLAEQVFAVPIKMGSSGKKRGRPRTKLSIFQMATVALMFRPMAISVDRRGKTDAPSYALTNTHSWP